MINADELRQIMPHAGARADTYLEPLNAAMDEFQIDTPQRQAAFLAQVAHESGSLRYVRELASGEAYEGRQDLGNDQPGDGVRYKGHGLIQITGKNNHRFYGDLLGVDLVAEPELLEGADLACRSAACVWRNAKLRDGTIVDLNEYADKGDIITISKIINVGLIHTKIKPNGLGERIAGYERAQEVLT